VRELIVFCLYLGRARLRRRTQIGPRHSFPFASSLTSSITRCAIPLFGISTVRISLPLQLPNVSDISPLLDPVVTPELFAQTVVEDYNLAPSYHSIIVKSIQDQLTDFRMHSTNYDGDGTELLDDEGQAVIKGTLDDEEAKWWEVWRRRVKLQSARALAEARALADEDEEGTGRSGSRQRHTSRKRQKVKVEDLDDDADADVSMLADNEGEEEDEDNERYAKEKSVVFDLDDDDFSPLSLEDIKLDEKAMHEDMRILIKVRFYIRCYPSPGF
jgi:SWI/SNF-related matrix-associated actin-dependent regulator of chromatin subfamily B protein 1